MEVDGKVDRSGRYAIGSLGPGLRILGGALRVTCCTTCSPVAISLLTHVFESNSIAGLRRSVNLSNDASVAKCLSGPPLLHLRLVAAEFESSSRLRGAADDTPWDDTHSHHQHETGLRHRGNKELTKSAILGYLQAGERKRRMTPMGRGD